MSNASIRLKGLYWIVGGWVAFIGENVIVSENREYIISRFGDDNYHILYNTLSTAACGSLAYGYYRYGRKQGPTIGPRSQMSRMTGFGFQSLGFIGLSQLFPEVQLPIMISGVNDTNKGQESKLSNPSSKIPEDPMSIRFKCPMDFKAFNAQKDGIFGMERISRHPVFWSLGLSCLGPVFRTAYLTEAVMYSFPSIMSFIGTSHMDSRYRRHMGGHLSSQIEQSTSNIPFVALIQGKQSWSDLCKDMRWSNAGIAVAIALKLALKK